MDGIINNVIFDEDAIQNGRNSCGWILDDEEETGETRSHALSTNSPSSLG